MALIAQRRIRQVLVAVVASALVLGMTACGTKEDPKPSDTEKTADPFEGKPLEVSFDNPDGFSKVTDVEVLAPLTKKYDAQFLKMDATKTNEMVFVISYALDVDTTDMDAAALRAQVAGFDATIGNTQKSNPYTAIANGHSGLHKYVKQPTGQGDEVLIYDAEYFFEGTHLVQVGCQREKDEYIADVYKACQVVLENLEF